MWRFVLCFSHGPSPEKNCSLLGLNSYPPHPCTSAFMHACMGRTCVRAPVLQPLHLPWRIVPGGSTLTVLRCRFFLWLRRMEKYELTVSCSLGSFQCPRFLSSCKSKQQWKGMKRLWMMHQPHSSSISSTSIPFSSRPSSPIHSLVITLPPPHVFLSLFCFLFSPSLKPVFCFVLSASELEGLGQRGRRKMNRKKHCELCVGTERQL